MQYNVKLNGTNITKYVVYPLTFEFVLDNALDQAYMEMRLSPRKTPYKPFSLIEISVAESSITSNTETIRFYLASDEVEVNMKTGRATHKLLLIEETKILERFICSAKSFVNPLYKDYDTSVLSYRTDLVSPEPTLEDIYNSFDLSENILPPLDGIYLFNQPQWSPIPLHALYNTGSVLPDIGTLFNFTGSTDNYVVELYGYAIVATSLTGEIIYENKGQVGQYTGILGGTLPTITLSGNGSYDVYYVANWRIQLVSGSEITYSNTYGKYTVAAMNESNIPGDLTITTVVNQLLDVAEPIRKSTTPRFSFNPDDAELYKDTPCAELNFANGATLRENLEAIAALVHAIPRLKNNVVYFDKLGGTEQINMTRLYTPISYKASNNTEKFASHLDSVVNGLMNMENINTGALTDPFPAGYRTLRSEVSNTDMRTKYDTAMIDTVCPIEKPTKVTFRLGGTNTEYDITPYIYEKQEYDLLYSGKGAYPYTKSYALYYIQGQSGIYGLNYKEDNALSPIFSTPALENIVKAASGNPDLAFDYETQWADCTFRVTYVTSISGRVRQTKRNVSEITTLSVIAYNQTENRVSSVNFGNRLKGEIAMYGNNDVVICHKTRDWNTVRNAAGKLYNDTISGDNMYINKVRAKIWREYMLVEFSLSKNFNQIGKYVGINSQIRQFEIDTNTQERYIVYEDYCVLGKNTGTGNAQPGLDTLDYTIPYVSSSQVMTFPQIVANTILQQNAQSYLGNTDHSVQLVKITTYDDDETEIDSFLLPVQSVALGNSIIFNFRFEDNYSAGRFLTNGGVVTNDEGKEESYKLTREARYGDYVYGEATYMKVEYWNNVRLTSQANIVDIGDTLPLAQAIKANIFSVSTDADASAEVKFSTGDNENTTTPSDPFIIHKSSRDMINFTYQIHFVTNDGLILGQALADENELIGLQEGHTYHEGVPPTVDVYMLVYFLNVPINEITGIKVNFSNDTRIISSAKITSSIATNGTATISLRDGETAPADYVSWAVIDSSGHFILGKNGAFEPFSIYTRHTFTEEEN